MLLRRATNRKMSRKAKQQHWRRATAASSGKLELGCDWCCKSLTPRHGSGGSKQKFCSRECQRTSNRERQRTHRRAAYVAARKERSPRDRGHRAAPPQTGCSTSPSATDQFLVVGLNEGETAGTRIESLASRSAGVPHRPAHCALGRGKQRQAHRPRGRSEIRGHAVLCRHDVTAPGVTPARTLRSLRRRTERCYARGSMTDTPL